MMAISAVIKKWGNSFGILLPKDFMEREGFREHETVIVQLIRKADISHTFGTLKSKMTGQQFKDLARKGWEP